MAKKVNFIPTGYHTATPYLICKGAAEAIDFYKKAFGAEELFRLAGPDGKLGHAEIKIGDSHIMLADEHPETGNYAPAHYGGSPNSVLLYVPNVDETVAQAISAGASIKRDIAEQFYGDRVGIIQDPFGHQWYVHTHVKDPTPEEMKAGMGA